MIVGVKMNAKEYLNQIRNLDKEINAMLDQRDQLRTMATRTSAGISFDKVSGGVWSNDRMGDCVAKLVDLGREIDRKVDRLADLKTEAVQKIETIGNSDYRLLLMLRYINGLTWEQVAVKMNFSYVHVVHNLHPKALKKVEELIVFNISSVI